MHGHVVRGRMLARRNAETLMNFRDRITVDATVHFGKPCVAGTRIPVEDVLELIQEGIAFADIVTGYYPDLDIDDVQACAKYATALVKSEVIHV
jgi:uncharacterized protein (DUF433 family)